MWNGSFTSWGIFSLGFLASIHLLNPLSLLYFYAWQWYHQFYFNFIVVKLQEGAYRLYTATVAMLFGIKCLEIFEHLIIYYYKLHNAIIRDFRMMKSDCVQGRGARFQHFNGFKNEMSRNVWSSCLVLLPQRENDIGTTCSNAPLSTTRTGCYHFSNIAPSGVSSPHGWEVQVLLKTTSARRTLLDMKEPAAPLPQRQLSNLISADFAWGSNSVIEELIFLPGFASFLRPIPDSQIHLCPFLFNAEIAPSHVFLTRKSQASDGASATRRDGREAILINNCQFYCRLPQTRMSGSTGERHSGWNVYFLWHNGLNFNDLCVLAMPYAAGTQSEPSSTTTLGVFGHGRLTV